MKLKTLFLTSMLFAKTLFASHDAYVPVYIPISDMSVDSGIKLHKVLFYTYYAHPESVIDSVVWSYKANTPHKRYKDLESNLAHIEGLKVSFKYKEENACEITIDSRNVISEYTENRLNEILKYVKEATVLNMKSAKLNCKIITKTAPKKITHFSPKALDLSKVNVKIFKENVVASSHVPFLQDSIYPLGYSNDGKFARKPMGFFASEENYKRVAILVGTVSRGWEGPPHNLSYEIIGANLSMGFKK